MGKIGFDTKKYLEEQSKYIFKRVEGKDKLYLEFGGKLIGDKHAKRVLPGFDEDAKLKLLERMKDQAEIIICVYAGDIESNKMRGDYGITYDLEVLRLIDEYHALDISVNSVLITRYHGEANATNFMHNLERRGIKVYTHQEIKGYPTNVDLLVENGFEVNPYIETTKPIVVVSGPGAGSGKLATCLNQLYHEWKRGVRASYAKFETFPVWNLSLNHPVNIAYEAATVDLKDVNMIDNYHYDAYGEVAVNYNRDLKMFPVIRRILQSITHETVYQSPTDMGVNCVKAGIIDDEVVRQAANEEIIRRSFQTENDYKSGLVDEEALSRMQLIMEDSNLKQEDRVPVKEARQYAKEVQDRFNSEEDQPVMALALDDGQIVTGRSSDLMDASGAVILNSLKVLAGIADPINLLSPLILQTIQELKTGPLSDRTPILTANELLIALAISASTNPTAQMAYDQLKALDGTQAHSTYILTKDNEKTLKSLGIDVTNDPVFPNENLYYQ
ncbi:DUF1846 domain-containing protein [Aerococcus urinae]